MTLKLFFLRWLCGWATLADGLVIVLTLGFVFPWLSEWADTAILDEQEMIEYETICKESQEI